MNVSFLFQPGASTRTNARYFHFSNPTSPPSQPPERDLIDRLSEVIPNPTDSNALKPLFEYLQDPGISSDHKNMLNKNIQWYALACLYYDTNTNLNMLDITVHNDNLHTQYPTVQDLLSNKWYDQCTAFFTISSKAPHLYGDRQVFKNINHTATYPANCDTGSDDARSNSGSEFSI